MRRGKGRTSALMAWLLLMVTLAACSEREAAPEAASPVEGASTAVVTSTATAQPSLEELYRPQAYSGDVFSFTVGPTRIPPPTIETANLEADAWLRGQAFEGEAPAWFLDVAGTEERRCVEVLGDPSRVRSGDFALDVSAWSGASPLLEVLPVRASRERLLLRAVFLDLTGADASNPPTHVHEYDWQLEWNAAEEFSYTPRFVLPQAGRWMVVATAGPVWGCFVLEAPPPHTSLEVARSIEEGEAAGAAYPSIPAPDPLPRAFAAERGPDVVEPRSQTRVDGTAKRACFDVTGIDDARSGEWVARPLSIYELGWSPSDPGGTGLLEPLHQPLVIGPQADRTAAAERLTLASTLLDDPRHTYVYEQPRLNARTPDFVEGPTEAFHITSFVHPRAGHWLMVATSGDRGPDWGCFLFDLGLGAP
ncbi:MAG: hypothetical protein R3C39_02450 [Dehalococcoidia bacterium]